VHHWQAPPFELWCGNKDKQKTQAMAIVLSNNNETIIPRMADTFLAVALALVQETLQRLFHGGAFSGWWEQSFQAYHMSTSKLLQNILNK
jgi:hypothetical protein